MNRQCILIFVLDLSDWLPTKCHYNANFKPKMTKSLIF